MRVHIHKLKNFKLKKKMKERLEKAKKEKTRVKLVFEYPNSNSAKVRRGIVKECRIQDFDFEEDKDGYVTYKYQYLVEVKNE